MNTKDFLEKYPQWISLYENRVYKKVPGSKGSGQAYVKCTCPMCGGTREVRWQPTVTSREDGSVPICGSCNYSEEGRSIAGINSNRTLKEKGWYKSQGWRDSRMKAFETAEKNGTFMRSQMELDIEGRFGGQHYFDGYYEIDIYYPELKLGIEVDDRSHIEVDVPGEKQKRKGYHLDKDKHFEEKGITILHLTFNHGDWEARVANFLDGVYEGPLIDLEDETYGDIEY